MGDSLKILGQSIPAAGVLTDIYIVPSATQTTLSSIVVCNISGVQDAFRIAVASGGVVDNLKQYLYYDLFLDANDTFIFTIGISITATDVVRVRSTNGTLSFNVFGVELI